MTVKEFIEKELSEFKSDDRVLFFNVMIKRDKSTAEIRNENYPLREDSAEEEEEKIKPRVLRSGGLKQRRTRKA